ncbi:MAG: DnaB-like helicase C-terminal domain-containing protein [Azonexus sp.]
MSLSQYNFSTDFQDELLVAMIRHPEIFMGLSGVIDYGYFTGTNSQMACKQMQDFYKKHNTYPNFAQLATLVIQATRQTGENDKATEVTAYVQKLSEVDIRAKEFYRDQAINFAKQRALMKGCMDVAKLIQEGKEPGGEIVKQFQDALAIGQNLLDQGYLVRQDYNAIVDKLADKSYGTFTGYELFDTKLWKRGWGPGWLIVPLAPPKRFKTAFCLNLAMNMVGPKCGYDVLYYACEINAELASLRCFQSLLGATQDEFDDDPEKFRARLAEGLQMKMQGELLIKHFPAKTATIADIRAHAIASIESLGIKPKAIFIDYAETIKTDSSKDSPEYRQQSDIYTQARALGSELGCCVIMPDRCNREAVNQATPQMDSFQGAFEKAGIVDISIGLCATDEEYDKGDLRFFTVLNRHGEGGTHLRGKVDKQRMRITIDEELKPYEAAEVEAQIQEQRDKKYGKRGGRGGPRGKSRETDPRLEEESAPIAARTHKPPRV